ncbi:MAG: YaiI/YqxD family protein [Candidatus Palauibacterales bacterium]|jgi:uncharacterized protein|nr:YaiI/YqxD family protein [Candidatus Palauibacterales bacterium]
MKIWIDADAAPREVRDVVYRAAKRLGLEVTLVANQSLSVPPAYPMVSAVRVDGGPDVADDHIADHAESGDLVVTQDIPLAARLVSNDVVVIDVRGTEHTEDTIGPRLSVRDFMDELRSTGVVTGGPPPFDAKAKREFASGLDRALTRMMRS